MKRINLDEKVQERKYAEFFQNLLSGLNCLSQEARKFAESRAIVYGSHDGSSGMGDIGKLWFLFRYKSDNEGGFFYRDRIETFSGGESDTLESERDYTPLMPEEIAKIIQEGKGYCNEGYFSITNKIVEDNYEPNLRDFFTIWGGIEPRIPNHLKDELKSKFPELKINQEGEEEK